MSDDEVSFYTRKSLLDHSFEKQYVVELHVKIYEVCTVKTVYKELIGSIKMFSL